MSLHLSLEPPRSREEQDLFHPPPRQLQIDGHTLLAGDRPLPERLARIWAERGDFSQLTTRSILNPVTELETGIEEETERDSRLSSTGMKELQLNLLSNLELARGELLTALDLLSVLSPPSDPPAPEGTLPLPPETLTLVPTLVPSPLSPDPLENNLANLPLATSLAFIKTAATSFHNASLSLASSIEQNDSPPPSSSSAPTPRAPTQTPDLWPCLLHLHSTTAYQLLPLGAQRGATLSDSPDVRSARQVGIFFGCEEAGENFRRASIARMGEVVATVLQLGEGEKFQGRRLVVRVTLGDGVEEEAVWDHEELGAEAGLDQRVEDLLTRRTRAGFAEELFSLLSDEARENSALKARLRLGKRSRGDSITLENHNWSLTISMVSSPPPPTVPTPAVPLLILSLLRLVLLKDFARRRLSLLLPTPPSPILGILSHLLNHHTRQLNLNSILNSLVQELNSKGIETQVEFCENGVWNQRSTPVEGIGGAVKRILAGDKTIGGLAVLRLGTTHTFHIIYSLMLPTNPPLNSLMNQFALNGSLLLGSPGQVMIPIPSISHLESFLREQIKALGIKIKQ